MEYALAHACAGPSPGLKMFRRAACGRLMWTPASAMTRATALVCPDFGQRSSLAFTLTHIPACAQVPGVQDCRAARSWRPGPATSRGAVASSWRMAAPTQPLLTGAQTALGTLARLPLLRAPASASCHSSLACERSCSSSGLPAPSCRTASACRPSPVQRPVQVLSRRLRQAMTAVVALSHSMASGKRPWRSLVCSSRAAAAVLVGAAYSTY